MLHLLTKKDCIQTTILLISILYIFPCSKYIPDSNNVPFDSLALSVLFPERLLMIHLAKSGKSAPVGGFPQGHVNAPLLFVQQDSHK